MIWLGAEAKARARAGAAAGIKAWADAVLAESQPLVPVSENTGGGFLKGTGTASVDEGALRGAVSYSGPGDKSNLPIWVHENAAYNHPVGQAKFLEQPLNASKTSGPALVAASIRASLGG